MTLQTDNIPEELRALPQWVGRRGKIPLNPATGEGAKVYLLVENATWEKVYEGTYRSRMKPDALAASLLAWCARYNLTPVFCRATTTGKMIARILRYEVKTLLEKGAL